MATERFENNESTNERVKTLGSAEFNSKITDQETGEVDQRFLTIENGGQFHYSPLESLRSLRNILGADISFSFVEVGGKVVAIAELEQSTHEEDVVWLKSVSVAQDSLSQGFTRKLIDEVMSEIKRQGKKIMPSSYTDDGSEKLEHIVSEVAAEHSVEVVSNR